MLSMANCWHTFALRKCRTLSHVACSVGMVPQAIRPAHTCWFVNSLNRSASAHMKFEWKRAIATEIQCCHSKWHSGWQNTILSTFNIPYRVIGISKRLLFIHIPDNPKSSPSTRRSGFNKMIILLHILDFGLLTWLEKKIWAICRVCVRFLYYTCAQWHAQMLPATQRGQCSMDAMYWYMPLDCHIRLSCE